MKTKQEIVENWLPRYTKHPLEDFTDYRITSTVIPYLHESAGLVARCRGHAMYYALLLTGGREVKLIRQCGREETLLAKTLDTFMSLPINESAKFVV